MRVKPLPLRDLRPPSSAFSSLNEALHLAGYQSPHLGLVTGLVTAPLFFLAAVAVQYGVLLVLLLTLGVAAVALGASSSTGEAIVLASSAVVGLACNGLLVWAFARELRAGSPTARSLFGAERTAADLRLQVLGHLIALQPAEGRTRWLNEGTTWAVSTDGNPTREVHLAVEDLPAQLTLSMAVELGAREVASDAVLRDEVVQDALRALGVEPGAVRCEVQRSAPRRFVLTDLELRIPRSKRLKALSQRAELAPAAWEAPPTPTRMASDPAVAVAALVQAIARSCGVGLAGAPAEEAAAPFVRVRLRPATAAASLPPLTGEAAWPVSRPDAPTSTTLRYHPLGGPGSVIAQSAAFLVLLGSAGTALAWWLLPGSSHALLLTLAWLAACVMAFMTAEPRLPGVPVVGPRVGALGPSSLRLRGALLSLGESAIDLSAPFALELVRSGAAREGEADVLGVILTQRVDGVGRRLVFGVPGFQVDPRWRELPRLELRVPLLDPIDFQRAVWGTLRATAAAHGQALPWEIADDVRLGGEPSLVAPDPADAHAAPAVVEVAARR